MSPEQLAARFSNYRLLQKVEGKDYEDPDAFDDPTKEILILAPLPDLTSYIEKKAELIKQAAQVIAVWRQCYAEPLLSSEQEYHLFRQFAYYKHRAAKFLSSDVEKCEQMLDAADVIKQQLAACNLRLLVKLAKRRREASENKQVHDLSELVSDGFLGLLRAVEMFDYRTRFRFSTYCVPAVLRRINKALRKKNRDAARAANGMDEILMEIPGKVEDQIEVASERLEWALGRLTPKEKQVVVDYYTSDESLGLQEIGESLKISKERVRQAA